MQHGTDLITQLAQIRERQGKEPMPNPGVIQGFGEGTPPPHPLDYQERQNDEFGLDDDNESPLVPPQEYYVKKIAPAKESDMPIPAGPMPNFKLLVMDSAAQYAGHSVVLTQQEQDSISALVIKALRRELDEHLNALPKGQAVIIGYASAIIDSVPSEKRKRGRPRKNAPTV